MNGAAMFRMQLGHPRSLPVPVVPVGEVPNSRPPEAGAEMRVRLREPSTVDAILGAAVGAVSLYLWVRLFEMVKV